MGDNIFLSCTLKCKPDQELFGRYVIYNLALIIGWHVITAKKQQQINIDNYHKNARQVSYDFAVRDLVYVDKTGIYYELNYNRSGPYRITEVFTTVTI